MLVLTSMSLDADAEASDFTTRDLRERPVVAMSVGGIRDVVEDGVNGLLVTSDDELAETLVRLLTDRPLAQRLGAGARHSAERWLASPAEYADRIARLVKPYTQPT